MRIIDGCFLDGEVVINGKVYNDLKGNVEITDAGMFVGEECIEEFQTPPVVKIVIISEREN